MLFCYVRIVGPSRHTNTGPAQHPQKNPPLPSAPETLYCWRKKVLVKIKMTQQQNNRTIVVCGQIKENWCITAACLKKHCVQSFLYIKGIKKMDKNQSVRMRLLHYWYWRMLLACMFKIHADMLCSCGLFIKTMRFLKLCRQVNAQCFSYNEIFPEL